MSEDGRRLVVDRARQWLGTPYHDRACVVGHGVDCGMIIADVFGHALGQKIPVEKYSPQWFLHRDRELYLESVLRYAHEIEEAAARPGDLVVYKVGRLYAHGAIIVDPGWPRIIHAYKPIEIVLEDDGANGSLGMASRRFFSPW